MQTGRILEGRGGLYTVRDGSGFDFILRAKNKFRREKMSPLVGDRVRFTPGNLEEHGWLEEILPRISLSVRPPVANITQLIIVIAPEPEPDLLLVDKLLVFANRQGIRTLIAVNKCDLDPLLLAPISEVYASAGVRVLPLSAVTGVGIGELAEKMAGEQSCFAGQSGTGKSTLISSLTGLELVSGAVSQRIRRGRQTTRHITLIEARGLCVLDTPGFSLLELPEDLSPEKLREQYPEFWPYQEDCRFNPCLHDQEPGCAVGKAVETGKLSRERLLRYRLLLAQTREKWSKRYD